jgi:hypothetical protein
MDTCAKDQSAPADARNPDIDGRIGRDYRHFLLRANFNFRNCSSIRSPWARVYPARILDWI